MYGRAISTIPSNSQQNTFASFSRAWRREPDHDHDLPSFKAHLLNLSSYRRFPSDEEWPSAARCGWWPTPKPSSLLWKPSRTAGCCAWSGAGGHAAAWSDAAEAGRQALAEGMLRVLGVACTLTVGTSPPQQR